MFLWTSERQRLGGDAELLRVLRDDADGQEAEDEIVGLVVDDLMEMMWNPGRVKTVSVRTYLLTASGKFLFVPGSARGFCRELVSWRTLLLTKSKSSPVVITLS